MQSTTQLRSCVKVALALLGGLGLTPMAFAGAPVYVASTGSDIATPACPIGMIGTTPKCPVASIATGVALAKPGSEVRVAAGPYSGLIELRAGITIAGGYSADFTKVNTLSQKDLESPLRTENSYPGHTRLVPATGADRVVVAKALTAEAGLRNLIVFGPLLDGKTGRSSYVIVAQDGQTLQLENVKLVAGRGEEGAAGAAPTAPPGTAYCNNGGPGGRSWVGTPDIHHVTCESSDGLAGSDESSGGTFGTKGKGAIPNCLEADDSYNAYDPALSGQSGGPGAHGLTGDAGIASADRAGTFLLAGSVLEWDAKAAGSGGNGGPGGGGGGGGAGGGRIMSSFWTNMQMLLGGHGGDGGRGGCGASQGGHPGSRGGGAFALTLKDVVVHSNGLAILQGQGGKGGAGGDGFNGWDGTPGMRGDVGLIWSLRGVDYHPGKGGDGGPGGGGGSSGGGAGGNGGPSIAVAEIGKVEHVTRGLFYVALGSGGEGGDGGKVAGALHGDSGLPGPIEKTYQFVLSGSK
ncbi:MAG: hypothetical protein WC213_00570 [Arenimonas sp.]|jgi:hypothetical protein